MRKKNEPNLCTKKKTKRQATTVALTIKILITNSIKFPQFMLQKLAWSLKEANREKTARLVVLCGRDFSAVPRLSQRAYFLDWALGGPPSD
jgi:hypothetical protein